MRQQSPVPEAVQKRAPLLGLLLLLALAAIGFACVAGSVRLGAGELAEGAAALLRGERTGMAATLLDLRLSRALSGFATGAMLALAGVMMQALLRNPLADPYVLGISGGASVGALSAMLFFNVLWVIDAAAFGGALAVALLLFALAHRDLRGGIDASEPLLLLTGVIVGAGGMQRQHIDVARAPQRIRQAAGQHQPRQPAQFAAGEVAYHPEHHAAQPAVGRDRQHQRDHRHACGRQHHAGQQQ